MADGFMSGSRPVSESGIQLKDEVVSLILIGMENNARKSDFSADSTLKPLLIFQELLLNKRKSLREMT